MPSLAPPRSDRVALHVVQLGAVAVVLVALPYKAFDLDRYFVPKELVLHLCAAAAAMFCLVPRRRVALTLVDWPLAGWLAVSAAGAVAAPNWWLASRALAISLSGAALFWVARVLRRDGVARAVVGAVVVAAGLGAATSLLQTYGVTSAYFSLNRAPGGTFGNRNFMAHAGAIAVPATLYWTLTARRGAAVAVGALVMAAIAAAQVLSRSRAAWLALLASGVLIALVAFATRRRWSGPDTARRLVIVAVAAAAAVIAALLLPNTLEWKSRNPYLESVRGMVNYQKGSGAGRLVQYTNSLRMTLRHPLLGVGAGNWPVAYPRYASRNDPSLTSADEGMTANPWPSSDWMAFLAERGVVAVLLLAAVQVVLLVDAATQVRTARTPEQLLGGIALGGTLVVTAIVGAFDAVLLTAVPAYLVWTLAGALAEPRPARIVITHGVPQFGPVAVFAAGLLAVGHSALQGVAMGAYGTGGRLGAMEQAAVLDPGNYRVQLRLARSYLARGACDRARGHAHRARELFPDAGEPREVLAACGERTER